MKKVFLHIGFPKTGTTSIQNFLTLNKLYLQNLGFSLPVNSLWPHENNILIAELFRNSDLFTSDLNVLTSDYFNRFPNVSEITSYLNSEKKKLSLYLSKLCTDYLIISCENLVFLKENELILLRNYLLKYFDTIEIIVYLRDQLSLKHSLLMTEIINGYSSNLLTPEFLIHDFPNHIRNVPDGYTLHKWDIDEFDYLHCLNKLEAVFPNSVTPRLFNKKDFINENIFSDFCSVLGINLSSDFIIPNNKNSRISFSAAKIINTFNKSFPGFKDGVYDKKRDYIIKTYSTNELNSQNYYTPNAIDTDYFYQKFDISNSIVRRKYFPKRNSLFDKNYVCDVPFDFTLSDYELGVVNFLTNIYITLDSYYENLHYNNLELIEEGYKGFNIIKTCYGAKFNSSDIFFAVPQSCGPLNHQQLIQMLPFLISSREKNILYSLLDSLTLN